MWDVCGRGFPWPSELAQPSICLFKPGHWCAVVRGGGARFPHLPSDTSCVNYQVASASAWLNICITTKVNAGEIYDNIFPRGKFALFFVKEARLTQPKWSQKTKPGLCSGPLPGLATFQNLHPEPAHISAPMASVFPHPTLAFSVSAASTTPSPCLLSSPMSSPPDIASTPTV